MLQYRKAVFDDCENIYHLICEMEQKELVYDKFAGIFQKQIENGQYYCMVCEQNDRIIGMLNLRFEEQLHYSECIAEIMELVIHSEFRMKGIGKDMISHACQIAKEHDCIQIEAACNQLRTNTHRFYLREGFQNYHFKFSKSLTGNPVEENKLGR